MITTSIILPSIRPQNLRKWYDAANQASLKNSWEVIIVSPYDLPYDLQNFNNIKYIKSKANPTVCKQMGCLLASGQFLFNTTDDAVLFPGSIDKLVERWENKPRQLNEHDIINARYREGALDLDLNPLDSPPPELPLEYWNARHHQSLCMPFVQKEWKISLHFFCLLSTFYYLGGLDTLTYENSVFPILEYCFLCQKLGGKIYDSYDEVSWCSHLKNTESDHSPIAGAMANDELIFRQRWSNLYKKDILTHDYEDWKKCPQVWERRFQ